MLYFKDKRGRVYRGLARRLFGLHSPSLTLTYWYMGKGVFTRGRARKRLKDVQDELLAKFGAFYR